MVKSLIVSFFISILSIGIYAQSNQQASKFDIRMTYSSLECASDEVCFDVQLRSGSENDWRMGGQNFRLFYNGNFMEFARLERVLNAPYTSPLLVQDLQHVSFNEGGSLPFNDNMSWLNYAIDINTSQQGTLLTRDEWLTTSRICFKLLNISTNPNQCVETVWARSSLTSVYATAFVEVSEWVSPDSLSTLVMGNQYFDFSRNDQTTLCYRDSCNTNECDNLAAPTSNGNQLYCNSSTSASTMSVSNVPVGAIVRWYNTATGGSVLSEGTSFTPSEPGIYYAESYRAADDCTSSTRTAITVNTIQSPVIEMINQTCSDDLQQYSLIFTTDADQVTSSIQPLEDLGQGVYQIQNISIRDSVMLMTTQDNCQFAQTVLAPNCNCPFITTPVSDGDKTYCVSDENKEIGATHLDESLTIDWYDSSEGGTAVIQNSSKLSLNNLNTPGTYNYYAESRSIINNCVSSMRIRVTITIDDCAPTCEAAAGKLTIQPIECFANNNSVFNSIKIEGMTGTNVPLGGEYNLIYILSQNGNVVDHSANTSSEVIVAEGNYTLHGFVYNTTTFNLNQIIVGTTTIDQLVDMINSNDQCGDLDIEGTPLSISYCANTFDLELEKKISKQNPQIGEEITFTIELKNNSSIDGTNISVQDILPSGYEFSGNLSDNGTTQVNENNTTITWNNLNVPGNTTEVLTFTAVVRESQLANAYKNTVQVIQSDQTDIDSTPNNDDGDQSEDDEAYVFANITIPNIDLEISKTVDKSEINPGQVLNYIISITNRSMVNATNITIKDSLPFNSEMITVQSISDGGIIQGNNIVWENIDLNFFGTKNFNFSIVTSTSLPEGRYNNVVQVTEADQIDSDSTPNNDDGDQSEDDEDNAPVEVVKQSENIDLSVRMGTNADCIEVNQSIKFFVFILNSSNVDATGISVSEMLPEGKFDPESVSQLSGNGRLEGNKIIWSDINLSPNESLTLGYQVAPTAMGDFITMSEIIAADQTDVDSTPNNNDDSEDDKATLISKIQESCNEEIVDLELTKTAADLKVNPGEEVNFTISIINNSVTDATQVIIIDELPEGLTFISSDLDTDVEGSAISWTLPSINSNEKIDIRLTVKVDDNPPTEMKNTAQVTAQDQNDLDSSPNNDDGDQSEDDEDSATLFIVDQNDRIDLSLEKSINESCFEPGDRIEFKIVVNNSSNVNATGVEVEDIIPAILNNISDISHGGEVINNKINWTNLSIPNNQSIELSFSAVVVSNTSNDNINKAQVTKSDQLDEDSTPNNLGSQANEDDESQIQIQTGATSDLELNKTVSNEHAQPGERVTFNIEIKNTGCISASNISVKDIFPSGYTNIDNISHRGERSGNVIVWNNIVLDAGASINLTFSAEVVHFTINCDYVNVAEIINASIEDHDSTPNNDDGDQSEDDEDSAQVFAGMMADLSVNAINSRQVFESNDTVTSVFRVCNNGPSNATNVVIRNYVPKGMKVVGHLNYKGNVVGDEITWSNFTFVAGDCVDLIIYMVPERAEEHQTMTSSTEILLSDQTDPDSTPGNNDSKEDDFASINLQHLVPRTQTKTIKIETALYLEGAYNMNTGKMNTTLNKLGYLPGQRPKSFFSTKTEAGQPYNKFPWNYYGNEGKVFNYEDQETKEYPAEVVDWVLISLRTDLDGSTKVVERAGLLMRDGTVEFPSDSDKINVDSTQSYYLTVHHRNHLPIMSPTKLKIHDGIISFDFRFNESYTSLLGTGQKEADGVYCVYAANGDQFKKRFSQYDINVNDLQSWIQENGQHSSYLDTDYDMNGDVNVKDQILWLYNNGVFSSVRD